jgi:hypothetical protein
MDQTVPAKRLLEKGTSAREVADGVRPLTAVTRDANVDMSGRKL